ncbi:preprotein translocase subunit YajC [Anaplasmataceae bacterium AB001_6]|nr:preprotein translocase subunit YajC [Anaplasmataceae bacterium AB001_6]
MSMLPLAVIFVVFYFLVIRPQSKKIKKHNNMLENLKKNDKVITSGGIIGTINRIVDKRVYLSISEDKNIEIIVDRNFISGLDSEAK